MTTQRPITAIRPKTRRCWFQFSLRTLVVAMLLVGIGLGWLGIKLQRQLEKRRAVAVILRDGGEVFYHAPTNALQRSKWLRSVIGDDVLLEVKAVYLIDGQATDAELVHLRGLTNLEEVCLAGGHVSDTGLAYLVGLTNLKHVWLFQTRISNEGVRKLREARPNLTIDR